MSTSFPIKMCKLVFLHFRNLKQIFHTNRVNQLHLFLDPLHRIQKNLKLMYVCSNSKNKSHVVNNPFYPLYHEPTCQSLLYSIPLPLLISLLPSMFVLCLRLAPQQQEEGLLTIHVRGPAAGLLAACMRRLLLTGAMATFTPVPYGCLSPASCHPT